MWEREGVLGWVKQDRPPPRWLWKIRIFGPPMQTLCTGVGGVASEAGPAATLMAVEDMGEEAELILDEGQCAGPRQRGECGNWRGWNLYSVWAVIFKNILAGTFWVNCWAFN